MTAAITGWLATSALLSGLLAIASNHDPETRFALLIITVALIFVTACAILAG